MTRRVTSRSIQSTAQARSAVRYVAGPEVSAQTARRLAGQAVFPLQRRDTSLGWIAIDRPQRAVSASAARTTWQSGAAVSLPHAAKAMLAPVAADVRAAENLMRAIASGKDLAELLSTPRRARSFAEHFDMLASYQQAGDRQEISTVEFDALRDGKIIAENLWIKAAWLSYHDLDPSLRFRFSFGMADIDDVGRDRKRQRLAADLAEKMFPECAAITANRPLLKKLSQILAVPKLDLVERIIYFNAPNGGAQFHHDVERGHRGVVFAQLSGSTFWLAIDKQVLVAELLEFLDRIEPRALNVLLPKATMRQTLQSCAKSTNDLASFLDNPDNEPVERIINSSPNFTRQLIERGFGFALQPGDVLLLPQKNLGHCCWHSVFCLGKKTGEALSFAMRPK